MSLMCGGGGGGGEVELTDAEKAAHEQMQKDAKQQTEKAKKVRCLAQNLLPLGCALDRLST